MTTLMRLYKLEGHTPVPVPDENVQEWVSWRIHADRHVAFTEGNGVTVSTVFTGIDLPGGGHLFETAIFREHEAPELQRGSATWSEAEARHVHVCLELGLKAP